jgi:5-(carboxyamino)imidazole ribonucleotide synthase
MNQYVHLCTIKADTKANFNYMFENLKIGILGGGQLGAMLMRYAIDFGLRVSVMDKDADVPCAAYTSSFHIGDPESMEDVIAFGKQLDIITIEKESVNVPALKILRDAGVRVFPSPEIIEIIQDKYTQKCFLEKHNIPTVPAQLVSGRSDIAGKCSTFPVILKKNRSGYDGNGVMALHGAEDIANAFDEPGILEKFVRIKHEISVIVSRNERGIIECYDPVLMVFNKERMILDFQMCPANINLDIATTACNIAIKASEALNLVGIIAVEMLVDKDDNIFVNEIAPRPHNSGHHTIEACTTSQFEQQIRLILGLPLGSAKTNRPSAMINILEPAAYRKNTIFEALKTILCCTDVHLHWYGKQGGREGRKMGHITITENSIENLLAKAVMIRHLLRNEREQN